MIERKSVDIEINSERLYRNSIYNINSDQSKNRLSISYHMKKNTVKFRNSRLNLISNDNENLNTMQDLESFKKTNLNFSNDLISKNYHKSFDKFSNEKVNSNLTRDIIEHSITETLFDIIKTKKKLKEL